MRLVDSHWSSGVTVVGFESSLIRSLDRELSVPQIELIYLSEDHRARLYQLVSDLTGFPVRYIAVSPSLD